MTAKRLNIRTVQTLHNYRPLCLNGLFMTPHKEICERCAGGNYWHGIVRGCYRGSRLQSAGLAAHLNKARHQKAYDAVDQFIAPSGFLKAKYVAYGFPPKKIVVQNHFLSDFPSEPPTPPEPYLFYLGRLSEEKGVRWLIQKFQSLSLPLRLIIGGDGPMRAEVEQAAKTSPISYLGYVSGDTKWNLLKRATALLVPSECYENFPLSVMEANAAGVPAIVCDQGGMREMVSSERNGERYICKDIPSFRIAVQRILRPEDPMPARIRCQQYAHSRFSQEAFLQMRLSIYRALREPIPA
jgi:glycosyltransferase involved in cell wall biosynthesis